MRKYAYFIYILVYENFSSQVEISEISATNKTQTVNLRPNRINIDLRLVQSMTLCIIAQTQTLFKKCYSLC